MVASGLDIGILSANDGRANRKPGVWRVCIFKFLSVPFQVPLVNIDSLLLLGIATMTMLEIDMTSSKVRMLYQVVKDCTQVAWIDRTIRIQTDDRGGIIDK